MIFTDAERAAVCTRRVARKAKELLIPYLIAIYDDVNYAVATQVGTGFGIYWLGHSVIVTAEHVLYGEAGNRDPAEKSIFADGHLQRIKASAICRSSDHDLAMFCMTEFPTTRCLSVDSLSPNVLAPGVVTVSGFLARDYKREARKGWLRPAPWIYTNVRNRYGSGYVSLKFPKAKNRNTVTRSREMVARPAGLSGGPMLDSSKLFMGKVEIVGVFTDYVREKGLAYGESSTEVLAMLEGM